MLIVKIENGGCYEELQYNDGETRNCFHPILLIWCVQNNNNEPADQKLDVDEEQLRTLWCGGVAEKVDEEILYELFLNAGPLERVTIPRDKEIEFINFNIDWCTIIFTILLTHLNLIRHYPVFKHVGYGFVGFQQGKGTFLNFVNIDVHQCKNC